MINLNLHYSPAQEWREVSFSLSMLYAVIMTKTLPCIFDVQSVSALRVFTGWSLRAFVKLTNLEFLPFALETQGRGNPGV